MRYIQLLHTTAAIICFFIVLLIPETGIPKDKRFCPGEEINFEVKWSFITAGEATLKILPYENIDDLPAYHFLFTAKTTKFVDVFYKIRDRMNSFTDIDLTHSLGYNKLHKGRETKIEFDWEKKKAQYINGRNETNSIQIENNTLDPLGVFYAFRVAQLDPNNEIIVNVTDGKRSVKGLVKIIKREKIKVSGKTFNTILCEPKIEGVGGVFEKSKNAKLQIWVTDDNLRIPVRIKSKVAVGSFVANLVSYTSGSDADCTPTEKGN